MHSNKANDSRWLKSTRRKACFTPDAKRQVFTPAKQVFILAEGQSSLLPQSGSSSCPQGFTIFAYLIADFSREFSGEFVGQRVEFGQNIVCIAYEAYNAGAGRAKGS